MHALNGAVMLHPEDAAPLREVQSGEPRHGSLGELPTVIYLDSRAFTRDCVGSWLQNSLGGFDVRVLSDPDQLEGIAIPRDRICAVIINAGPERMSSAVMTRLYSRVHESLPDVPVVVVSDHEDAESIREAFELGVRGYIPTSVASRVAVGAVHLVCVGGTFAPAAALLSQSDRPRGSAGDPPLIEGFTRRQSQILECLRRGMANKLIAYELNMCESTVKVHIRDIMKKLNATNRTQVAYLTRGFFEDISHQSASLT
jgi:DNA-binding NarL/FixJ family response regulator